MDNTQKKLAFVITTPPNVNLTATAIDMVTTALNNNIEVIGVFFYQSGVLNASANLAIPNDEYQACSQWCALQERFNVPLHLCSTAAEKHGLSDELPTGANILPNFTVSGLGTLVELTVLADKVIQL